MSCDEGLLQVGRRERTVLNIHDHDPMRVRDHQSGIDADELLLGEEDELIDFHIVVSVGIFVVGIDDQYLMVKVKSSQEPKKVQFADAFNKKWNYFLKKTVGDCWDLNISYYSPSHYIKAIDL